MGEHRTPRDEASPATEPTPLGGEQIAIVAAVYRRFARLAAESLTTLARTPLQVRLTAVQRLACRELRARWAETAALASISLDPLPGAALGAVDRRLAFLLIDRMLGGRGATAVPDRGLSEIEGTVLERALTALLPDLQHAWQPVYAIVPRLEYLERQADTADLLAPDTYLVGATFAVAAGRDAGHVHLAMAEASLAEIGHRLRAREFPGAERTCNLPPRQPAGTAEADAMLTVELGGGGLRSEGGTALDEGMVIGMSRFAGGPVAIEMNNRPVARGRLVAWDDSFGIRVTEILTPRGGMAGHSG